MPVQDLLDEPVEQEPAAEEPAPRILLDEIRFARDWLDPKGLRLFHPEMLRQSVYLPQILRSNRKQAVVDRLFDHSQKDGVTFAEFRRVWEHIGGEIVGQQHGGPHRQLIGPPPASEKLFGVFAFNAQKRHKSIIKYLQAAVWYIGLRPSQWFDAQ